MDEHLSCTVPQPLALAKDAPPLPLCTTFATSINLNSFLLPRRLMSKSGDTITLFELPNLLLATIHRILKQPLRSQRSCVSVASGSNFPRADGINGAVSCQMSQGEGPFPVPQSTLSGAGRPGGGTKCAGKPNVSLSTDESLSMCAVDVSVLAGVAWAGGSAHVAACVSDPPVLRQSCNATS